jgi:hypothetical protein
MPATRRHQPSSVSYSTNTSSQCQFLHRVAHLLRGAFIADFHFQFVDARADVIGQPGRTGIVVVHVRHQVVGFLDMFDAVQAEQQVADGTGVVFGSGDAQSQHGHGVGTVVGLPAA